MAVAYGKGNLIQKDLELKSEVTSIRQQVAAPGIPLGKLDSLGRKRRSWSNTKPSQGGLTIKYKNIWRHKYKGTGK